MDLVTLPELRVWTREAIDAAEDIEFAETIIAAVTSRVQTAIDHEGWEASADAHTINLVKSIAGKVASRSYLNPTQEIRTPSIGPIGGSSYHEDFARFIELTEREQEQLADVGDKFSGSSGLGVVRIVRDDLLMHHGRVGARDIVLNDSDAPQSAGIAYAHESDAMWFTEEGA